MRTPLHVVALRSRHWMLVYDCVWTPVTRAAIHHASLRLGVVRMIDGSWRRAVGNAPMSKMLAAKVQHCASRLCAPSRVADLHQTFIVASQCVAQLCESCDVNMCGVDARDSRGTGWRRSRCTGSQWHISISISAPDCDCRGRGHFC